MAVGRLSQIAAQGLCNTNKAVRVPSALRVSKRREPTLRGPRDVRTPFLQGRQEDRDDDLLPPTDGVCVMAGTFRGGLTGTSHMGLGGDEAATDCWFYSAFEGQDAFRQARRRQGQENPEDNLHHFGVRGRLSHDGYQEVPRPKVLSLFFWGSQSPAGIGQPLEFKGKEITPIKTKYGIGVLLSQKKSWTTRGSARGPIGAEL